MFDNKQNEVVLNVENQRMIKEMNDFKEKKKDVKIEDEIRSPIFLYPKNLSGKKTL